MIRLSDSEWQVMELLWEQPRTLTELTAAFSATTGWNKATIMTFLHRMEEKDAVGYEQGARAKRYFPKIARQDAQLEEASQFLSRCFSGSIGLMVNTLLSGASLKQEEIDELYEILKQAEAKQHD